MFRTLKSAVWGQGASTRHFCPWVPSANPGVNVANHTALRRMLLAAVIMLGSIASAHAQVCAAPGRDGDAALAGTVNTYWTPGIGSFSGASSIPLSAQRGASATLAEGDLLLVIQMQCATIDFSDSLQYGDGAPGEPASGYSDPLSGCQVGRYQFVRAAAGSGNAVLNLAGSPLLSAYQQAPASNTAGRRTFQVIRVPQYANAQLAGALAAEVWDGFSGGILVLDVASALNFNGQAIDLDGAGFRGAGGRTQSAADAVERFRWDDSTRHAVKGEGIVGTPQFLSLARNPDSGAAAGVVDLGVGWGGYPTGTAQTGDFARGAPGNAGGGGAFWNGASDNGGGGGGANGGAGGRGAAGWRSAGYAGILADYSNLPDKKWGFGGSVFAGLGVSRMVLGGGGGAGDNNNNSLAAQSSGAAGGGVVMVRAGTLSGTGAIRARGARAADNPLNDGAGGGGAGGSVLVVATTSSASLAVDVRGGRGGDAWPSGSSAHGSGGGGGGGVAITTAFVAVNLAGGAPGITNTAQAQPGGASHGAQDGIIGVSQIISPASDTPGSSVGRTCQSNLQVTKTNTPGLGPNDQPADTVASGSTVAYSVVVTNVGPRSADNAVLRDPASTGLDCTSVTCGAASNGALCPAVTVAQLQSAGGLPLPMLPANGSLTFTLTCTVTASGLP